MPADETKPAAADAKKPEEKPTDVLGEIDGVPLTRADAEKAGVKADEKTLSDAEHHAALTKREEVTLIVPARIGRKGKRFPEQRSEPGENRMVSLRCAVTHRVLHGMSPKELEALKAAAPKEAKSGDAFDHWALRHIESKLAGVPEGVLATQEHMGAFGQPEHVAKHRAAALAAVAPS